MSEWQDIIDKITILLSPSGIDLIRPFPLELYNDDELCSKYALPKPSTNSSHLGIVFGNSKKMWEPFLDHLSSDKDVLCNAEHPIHDYVKMSIEAVLKQLPGEPSYEIRFPYDEDDHFVVSYYICIHICIHIYIHIYTYI
jgi:hypothetical protein